MNTLRKRRWFLIALLLLLLFLLGWLVWPDRNLSAAKALQQQLLSDNAKSLTSAQRQEKWQALREAQKRLTPAQRHELSAEMRKRRQAEMAKYFRLSPVDKTRYLDQQIRRTEQMRRQRAQNSAGSKGGRSGSNTTARQRTASAHRAQRMGQPRSSLVRQPPTATRGDATDSTQQHRRNEPRRRSISAISATDELSWVYRPPVASALPDDGHLAHSSYERSHDQGQNTGR